MKRLIASAVVIVLLLCSLTSCLPDVVKQVMDSIPDTEEDFTYVANNIAPTAVKAGVRVEATFYSVYGMITDLTTQGSGVVYYSTAKVYFILTNRHVVEEDGRLRGSCTVYDAYGKEYNATVVATDADYDLAVLTIMRDGQKLETVPFADKNADSGDMLFSVGTPNGLNNLVTYGDAISYAELEDDNLDFSVLAHTAVTEQGSSGGGLYNAEGKLVGINFAGGENTESEEKYSFAIPIEQVRAFLEENGYTVG